MRTLRTALFILTMMAFQWLLWYIALYAITGYVALLVLEMRP